MRFFCTIIDQPQVPRFHALRRSLTRHIADCEFWILCSDDAAHTALHSQAHTNLRILSLTDFLTDCPELAKLNRQRTPSEFSLLCRPWLIRQLLSQIPEREFVTFLSPSLYFFNSPTPAFSEFRQASIGLIPLSIETPGNPFETGIRMNSSWMSFRNDEAGRAYATAWTDASATSGHGRSPFSIFDRWPEQKSGVVVLQNHSGLVAPANLSSRSLGPGPTIEGTPLISYDFGDLLHLDRQLYDPGLSGCAVSHALREYVYWPYLRELSDKPPSDAPPDIIPPADPNDTRCSAVLSLVASRLRETENAKTGAESALATVRSSALAAALENQARTAESERFLHHIEQDRDKQRQAFFATRQRLEEIHQDLLHNIAYLKKLESEASAAQQASVDRENYVSSLKQQLAAQHSGGHAGPDLSKLHEALIPHGRELRRVLVARYNPALMPLILSLAAQGASIDVLGSPLEYIGQTHGSIHFLGGELWTWLAGINSFFDEPGYLRLNPDVAAAIRSGGVRSAWDHYQRFGQHEGRSCGVPNFRMGLADFDGIAFDSADAGPIVPCLVGRLQRTHRLFVSSSFNPATVWLPGDTHRIIVHGDLLCCPRPPTGWLGPCLPSAFSATHRPAPTLSEIFPATPAQPAVWPRITVVTTSCNQAADLETTLRSVLDQHYPMLEYLVVDAASTDDSAALIHRYADRLTWWTSEPCTGTADALAKGFAKASGSILTWLNPGDQLAPGSLFTVALQFLLHIPDIVAGRCATTTGDGSIALHRSVISIGNKQPLPLQALRDLDNFWLKHAFFLQPGTFVTRDAWDRAGGLDSKLAHAFDYDLWLRLGRNDASVLHVPEVLARQAAGVSVHTAQALSELRAISVAQPSPVPTS